MYVDDLGQIVEVVPFSLPSRSPALSLCSGLILGDALVLLCPTFPVPSTCWTSWGRGFPHQGWPPTLMLPPQPSCRVTWPPWLLRGSRRVFEAVTGLCLGTSSKSMSGIESEWWIPESEGEGRMSHFLCNLARGHGCLRNVWSCLITTWVDSSQLRGVGVFDQPFPCQPLQLFPAGATAVFEGS